MTRPRPNGRGRVVVVGPSGDRCPSSVGGGAPCDRLSGASAPGAGASRRTFLVMLLGAGASLGLAGLLAPIARFVYPVVKTAAAASLRVATRSRLEAAGGELDFEYQEVPAALIRLGDGSVVGVSRVCTHLGCIIKWDGEDGLFRCPCHAGYFGPTGDVVGGPPPRPLARLVVDERGEEIWVTGWQSG